MSHVQAAAKQDDGDLRKQFEEMKAAKEAAEAQLVKEKEKTSRVIYFKVSEKGGASLYGIRKQFPITLYVEEWDAVYDLEEKYREFKAKHDGELTRKQPNGKPNGDDS